MNTTALRGAGSGLVATVPMTLAMMLLKQRTAPQRRRSLAPAEVTRKAANTAGAKVRKASTEEKLLTLLSRFSFGAAAGSTYAKCMVGPLRPGIKTGIAFGVGLWAANYLGLLPALKMQPPAGRQPKGRHTTMIVAHVVWGAALGGLLRLMKR